MQLIMSTHPMATYHIAPGGPEPPHFCSQTDKSYLLGQALIAYTATTDAYAYRSVVSVQLFPRQYPHFREGIVLVAPGGPEPPTSGL